MSRGSKVACEFFEMVVAEGSVWEWLVSLRVLVWLSKSAFLRSIPWSIFFLGVNLDSSTSSTQKHGAGKTRTF